MFRILLHHEHLHASSYDSLTHKTVVLNIGVMLHSFSLCWTLVCTEFYHTEFALAFTSSSWSTPTSVSFILESLPPLIKAIWAQPGNGATSGERRLVLFKPVTRYTKSSYRSISATPQSRLRHITSIKAL